MQFGRYQLERRLALGGMAEVFLARIEGPEGFAKRVVIKRLLPHLRDDREQVQMFLDEAKLAARFNHPNLVQIYELARIDDQYAFVMEHIEGEDVASILDANLRRKTQVPFEMAAYITAGAALGLHYVHELGDDEGRPLHVVHRDVSPANIIVTRSGGVKIVDFGIAKHVSTVQTVAGMLKGKFSYMSPEQARGEPLDPRSDIFALGIVLYELLTVTPCFPGSGQMEILDAVTQVRFEPAETLRPGLPRSLKTILARMLALKRDDRYDSAHDVHVALARFMNETRTPAAGDVSDYLAEL
ncbi:MAG: serine/threonine protein kinase, partial [Deltaproteobacteria bacterium]|nr:serine/threonine protein kinase [Deltaproteobacteria bacterium]